MILFVDILDILRILAGFGGVLELSYFCAILYVRRATHVQRGTSFLAEFRTCLGRTYQSLLSSFHFVPVRYRFEEQELTKFFRSSYTEYRQRTVVGIPFIA